MSPSRSFATDADAVTCVEFFNTLIERHPLFIPCNNASGTPIKFVTVQRWAAAATEQLSLQEVMVWRSAGARVHASGAKRPSMHMPAGAAVTLWLLLLECPEEWSCLLPSLPCGSIALR